MKTENLFGEMVDVEGKKTQRSPYQRIKNKNRYRGRNIPSQSCKTCKFHIVSDYHNKRYHKCELIGFSPSTATDIKVSNVCDKWEQE